MPATRPPSRTAPPTSVPAGDLPPGAEDLVGRYAHFDAVAYEDEEMKTVIISTGLADLELRDGELWNTMTFCAASVASDQGIEVSISDAATRAIIPVDTPVEVSETDDGSLRVVRPPTPTPIGIELEDPANEELPTDPDDPRIIDADGDGNPGVTSSIRVSEDLQGEVYLVRREIFAYDVTQTDPDRLVGTITDGSEQLIVGASDPVFLASRAVGAARRRRAQPGHLAARRRRTWTATASPSSATSCSRRTPWSTGERAGRSAPRLIGEEGTDQLGRVGLRRCEQHVVGHLLRGEADRHHQLVRCAGGAPGEHAGERRAVERDARWPGQAWPWSATRCSVVGTSQSVQVSTSTPGVGCDAVGSGSQPLCAAWVATTSPTARNRPAASSRPSIGTIRSSSTVEREHGHRGAVGAAGGLVGGADRGDRRDAVGERTGDDERDVPAGGEPGGAHRAAVDADRGVELVEQRGDERRLVDP